MRAPIGFSMLPSLSLLTLLGALLTGPVGARLDSRDYEVLECHLSDGQDRDFVMRIVKGEELDIWAEHIQSAAQTVRFRANARQKSIIKNGLICPYSLPLIEFEAIAKSDVKGPITSDYVPYSGMEEQLQKFRADYPHLVKQLADIGMTHEGRVLRAIHLTSRSGGEKPKIWYVPHTIGRRLNVRLNGGQHAREWISPAGILHFAQLLLEGFTSHVPAIVELLQNYEILICPQVNPDGYEYSRRSNRYWRKNRRPNPDGSFGVDLNRNWPGRWGTTWGDKSVPSSDVYQGPSAGSEPEVSSIIRYLKGVRGLVAGIDLHSYGELVLRNFGWTAEPCPEEALFSRLGSAMAAAMNAKDHSNYVSQRSGQLYPAHGSMDDWFYDAHRMPGFTIELQDKGFFAFLLPPSRIASVGEEILAGVLALAKLLPKSIGQG